MAPLRSRAGSPTAADRGRRPGPTTGWSGKLWAIAARRDRANRCLLTTPTSCTTRAILPPWLRGRARVTSTSCPRWWRSTATAPAEQRLFPAFVFFFQLLYPFGWVNDPLRATAAAAGGTMLLAGAGARPHWRHRGGARRVDRRRPQPWRRWEDLARAFGAGPVCVCLSRLGVWRMVTRNGLRAIAVLAAAAAGHYGGDGADLPCTACDGAVRNGSPRWIRAGLDGSLIPAYLASLWGVCGRPVHRRLLPGRDAIGLAINHHFGRLRGPVWKGRASAHE